MTESDALTKWCPMVRVGAPGGDGFNRDSQAGDPAGTDYPLYKCVASACALWEETEPKPYGIPRDGKTSEPTGDCGLARK